MKKNILIISTDATRTGTPVFLYNFLLWLKQNSEHNFVILFQNGGEMLPQFESLFEVHVWNTIPEKKIKHLFFRVIKKLFSIQKFIKLTYNPGQSNDIIKVLKRKNFDLVISNTARNGRLLIELKEIISHKKLLVYVHEGERTLDLFNSKGDVTYNLINSHKIIAVSETIKSMLIKKFNLKVPIEVISGGIDTSKTFIENERILDKYGIPQNKKVIMSCGWLGWLKGVDFFIQIASKLSKIDPDFHFVWLGGSESDKSFYEMQFDIDKYQLKNSVTIITSQDNPMSFMAECDLFLMLSREESLSLVTIEAAYLKKVVLCFDKSGGPNEILDHNERFIVEYGNIDQMCERILQIINNKELYNQLSSTLYKRIIENYTIQKNALKFLKTIDAELIN